MKSWKPKDQRMKKTWEFNCHKLQSLEKYALKAELYPHKPLVTSTRLMLAAWVKQNQTEGTVTSG